MVKDPPGNDKTRTTVVILLMLASLDLPVLICAGSNQAVDTLLIDYQDALRRDQRLRQWCGSYCGFRTPYYQMASLRWASQRRPIETRTIQPSWPEKALEACQIESWVVQETQEFLNALDRNRAQGLTKKEAPRLQSSYEHVLCRVLRRMNVVAVTLNASGDLDLQGVFHPYAMPCDEAGQSLESDTMIELTGYLSFRSITLIGDPDQLPPRVVSWDENEGGKFYARSLMSRLVSSYPLTLLKATTDATPKFSIGLRRRSIRARSLLVTRTPGPNVWAMYGKHSPIPSTISGSGDLLGSGVFSLIPTASRNSQKDPRLGATMPMSML